MLTPDALAKLRARIRVRFNWFLAALLGPETLSREELLEVVELKPLPDREISVTERSFLLGRMKLLMRRSEWKEADLKDLMRASKEMTPLERLAVADARQQAATHIRGLEADIAAGVFTGIQSANARVLKQATVQGAIKDEVAQAVLYRKSYEQLAEAMTRKLGVALTPRWVKISRTELHRAKVAGGVQAIVNKVGPFQNLDGVDTKVSIISNPGTCPDCAKHYTDASGNPKVFTLRQLLAAGTNADGSVSHKKSAGVHTHWKTVLPPLHPGCACTVVPVPPGMGWVNGSIVAIDVVKAFGDSALSATAKPKGPDSVTAATKAPPSIPGIKSPGQKTPQATAATGDAGGGAGDAAMKPCIFGGDERCAKYGGKLGSKEHKAGSKADLEHQKAVAQGVKSNDPEAAQQDKAQAKIAATAWDKEDHPHHVALNHLSEGVIAAKDRLGEEQSGIQDTYKVAIAGNGSALFKPNQTMHPDVDSGKSWTEGCTTVPHGQGAEMEKAAYNAHMAFGLQDHVPPTETRMDNGQKVSMQSWQEGSHSAAAFFAIKPHPEAVPGNQVDHMIQSTPPSKQDALIQKLSEGSVMAMVLNHQDQHMNNVMWDSEKNDVRFIDNTSIGGNGMSDHKNMIHSNLHSLGRKLKVPPGLLEKFSKTSLGDIKRATSSMQPWQQGQTFLRMQYVQHLQNAEGHLDFNKFKPTLTWPNGDETPRGKHWDEGEHERAQEQGTTPSALFDSFAKQWMSDHASDPSSPHHADAQALQELGVFMPSNLETMKNPAAYRASGEHLKLAAGIQGGYPEKALPAGGGKKSKVDPHADTELATVATKKPGKADMSTRNLKKSLFIKPSLLTIRKESVK